MAIGTSELQQFIRKVLWGKFQEIAGRNISEHGYVASVEDNLLPGISLDMFQKDLERGSGNELEGKFKAVHSSSALAVNTFSPFIKTPADLALANINGFSRVIFERQCPTGLGGTPPNLDVLAESDTDVVAVESKFLEYISLKQPHFAKSYTKANLPQAEDCWIDLIRILQDSEKEHLDAAQLVKHYLGLKNQPEFRGKRITLLYLYWEPTNWQKYDVFVRHKEEIDYFANRVKNSSVLFKSQSYADLWDGWLAERVTVEHVRKLQQRYCVYI